MPQNRKQETEIVCPVFHLQQQKNCAALFNAVVKITKATVG
jgi:hypothetical protein